MYKGFMDRDDADTWLKSITPLQEEKHIEHVRKAKAIKALKQNSVRYTFSIDQKLSNDLQVKLDSLHLSIDHLLDDLIREYLYGEN